MTLDASGNLGIGTTSPGVKLDVNGQSRFGGVLQITGEGVPASGAGLELSGSTSGTGITSFNRSLGTFLSQGFNALQYTFLTSGTEQMRLTSTGLGIGTSSPTAKLHVVTGVEGESVIFNNTNTNINATNVFGYLIQEGGVTRGKLRYYRDGTGRLELVNQVDGPLVFGTNDTERARIDSSGNLLVGTTTASAKFTVDSGSASELGYFNSTNANGGYVSFARSGTIQGDIGTAAQIVSGGATTDFGVNARGSRNLILGTNNAERARIDSSGNFRIGLTAAAYNTEKLTVFNSGDVEAGAFVNNAGANNYTLVVSNRGTTGDNKFMVFATEGNDTTRGSITYNRAGGLVAYNTTSDYRAKDISGPVTGSGALIDSVPVYMGKMKGATQERPMFIAHEVPAYAHTGEKDAVDKDGKPVYQQMDAGALIPVMWAELQSLRARVAQLESKP
jgi:hypothetical protein